MSMLSFSSWSVFLARIVAALWCGFWIWFGIASALFEQLDLASTVLHVVLPGLLFVLLWLVAWRWEAVGGGLLLLAGVAICVAYLVYFSGHFAWTVVLAVLLTTALPPLLSGALLLSHWRQVHHHEPHHAV